jgi:ferritin
MLAKKVEETMNEQLAIELQSSYVYLGMSSYCESASLPGCAQWLRAQAQEEYDHAMRFYGFITDRGARVRLRNLDAPPTDYPSALAVFEKALDHERSVTGSINKLYELVAKERDFASQAWLDWFATEQVEEEKTVGHIVDQIKMAGDKADVLFFIDRELGGRAAATSG